MSFLALTMTYKSMPFIQPYPTHSLLDHCVSNHISLLSISRSCPNAESWSLPTYLYIFTWLASTHTLGLSLNHISKKLVQGFFLKSVTPKAALFLSFFLFFPPVRLTSVPADHGQRPGNCSRPGCSGMGHYKRPRGMGLPLFLSQY